MSGNMSARQRKRQVEIAVSLALENSGWKKQGITGTRVIHLTHLLCLRWAAVTLHRRQREAKLFRRVGNGRLPGLPPCPHSVPVGCEGAAQAGLPPVRPAGLRKGLAGGLSARVEEVRAGVETRVEEVRAGVEEVRAEVETRVAARLDLEKLVGLWPAVVDQVRTSGSEFLSAPFEDARPVAVDAEAATVEIGFPPSAAFNKRKAEAKESRDRLTEALRTIVGSRLSPTYVMIEEEPEPAPNGSPEGAPEVPEAVDEGELVERFKAEFDAEELIDHPEEGKADG